MAQTERKPFMTGNVRISELEGFTNTSMNGIRGCFIPYDSNPCLFVGQNKESGAVSVDLDILVRETRNSKSGSTHFVKLNVGKANRERLSIPMEAVDSMKIVGNLWTRMPGQTSQGQMRQQSAGTPRQGGQMNAASPVWGTQPSPAGDLPAGW